MQHLNVYRLIKCFSFFIILVIFSKITFAQYDAPLYTSYTTESARIKLHDRLIKYSIAHNLSLPLSDSTEENWEEAFNAIAVLLYKSPFSDEKINKAFDDIATRSVDFQKALIELAYTNYPDIFHNQVKNLISTTDDSKVFAICAEYLLQEEKDSFSAINITKLLNAKFADQSVTDPVLSMLQLRLAQQTTSQTFLTKNLLTKLFGNKLLPGKTVMYSIQRKNRDYPGIVIVRDGNGNFVTDSIRKYFSHQAACTKHYKFAVLS